MKVWAAIALLCGAVAASAAPIPAAAFPGFVFDPPLEDGYQTGEAILIAGQVADGALSDGQFLLQFSPADGGEPVQVFINLAGLDFRQYHIFDHGAAGTYAVDLFAGGAGASQLGFIGAFEGFALAQGGGPIVLPEDFFPGVELAVPLSTRLSTSAGASLSGRVSDPSMADGQILFNFVPVDSGEEISVFIALAGRDFRKGHLFPQGAAGAYDLEVYLGGPGDESLSYIGGFPVEIIDDGAAGALPVDFFTGVVLDRPLSVAWPVQRDLVLRGEVAEGIASLRFDLVTAAREIFLDVPVAEGRFAVTVRLDAGELGPFDLQVLRQLADGQFLDSGSYRLNGVEPPPAPVLELGALSLGLLPGVDENLRLANLGAAALADLRFEVTGPFSVVAAPERLEPGSGGAIVLRYDGSGGDHGTLWVHSDDPLRPVRQVALNGLNEGSMARDIIQQRADGHGIIDLDLDLDRQDYALVLYPGEVAALGRGMRYPFALGGAPPAARRVARDGEAGFELALRRRESALAERWREYKGAAAMKPVGVRQVGAQREFVFEEDGGVPRQRVGATLVAVSEHGLGWLEDDLRPHENNIGAEDIARIIEQFSAEDYDRIVATFGRPSDVDGDGRISFLFTHLVDDLDNVAGFFSASAVLPEDIGGDGNRSDLLFISPTQPLDNYRPLLVHEIQHLINFNEHVLVRRGAAEVSWLNEGLSHVAEDLVANYATSGNGGNIAEFLRDPAAVSLEPEADDDARHRGAAYLFVRSLVDRMGPGVLLRLVGTELADRNNVEAATGEGFAELLAAWGTQLYISGLGLNGHPRFNFSSDLLRAGDGRGFALPRELEYEFGGAALAGDVPFRGLVFVRTRGSGRQRLEIASDPTGRIGVVAIPLAGDFAARARIPADYVPGVRFHELVPAEFVAGRRYEISGEFTADGIEELALGFVGADSLDFFAETTGTGFVVAVELPRAGAYELNFFAGPGGGASLDFAAGFGPIWVRERFEPTAVVDAADTMPDAYRLEPVYPNPFNANAVIALSVPVAGGTVAVEIFNALGQRVRTLYEGVLPAGMARWHWDGRGESGQALATGLYIVRVEAPGYVAVRRAVLLR